MYLSFCRALVSVACVLCAAGSAGAQLRLPAELPPAQSAETAQPVPSSAGSDWTFAVYPILAWVPADVGIEVDLPFDIGGGDGGSGGSGGAGGDRIKLLDTRFDGAALVGFAATNGTWRFDFDGVYAAVGGDRELPNVTIDVNLIYGHGTVSRKVVGDLFVSGGFRRLALKYEIDVLGFDTFERKPGIWDPLVGVGYHKRGDRLEFHATAEYGGFGVGADSDFGATVRLDWKPWDHFGFTGGYNFLRFEFEEEIGPFEFSAVQRIGGPVVGIGIYF